MSETLSIGELARRAGIAPSAIRYYDRIGLVHADSRDGQGRRYRPRALVRLELIQHFQHAGFSLDEIRQLLDGAGSWHDTARRKRAELSERVDELRAALEVVDQALACGCQDLEGCRTETRGHEHA